MNWHSQYSATFRFLRHSFSAHQFHRYESDSVVGYDRLSLEALPKNIDLLKNTERVARLISIGRYCLDDCSNS